MTLHDPAAARGLDWLNLYVANIQTGFGPFIAVYLTTRGWTQTAIGFALSLGTVTAMASQLPAGALVDAMPRKTGIVLLSLLAFTASALCLALHPSPLLVYLAEILHGFSSCTLGPAIAALSLAIAGHHGALGPRLGRNARFASLGNGIGAGLMGACGYYLSDQAVFFLTALLTLPALLTLRPLSHLDAAPLIAEQKAAEAAHHQSPRRLLADRRLLVFAACITLFTLANAAMLPLAGTSLTRHAAATGSLLIAACIVLPQAVAALLSPAIGRLAEARGRRPVLLLGFCALPLRGLLLALVSHPLLVVLVQVLDGVAATCLGVATTLVISDIAADSGHFNLSLGFVGFTMGVGATLSTALAGWTADRLGDAAAFACLTGIGAAALLLAWTAMAETRP